MHIEWLQARHVRNLSDIVLEPAPGLNLVTGPNASGKTSLLEACYILSRGRSFRTPRIAEVIQWNQSELLVSARLKKFGRDSVVTGMEKQPGKTVIKYNGAVVGRISEQAQNLPLVLVNPDSHGVITGDPRQRRHWLDWAMFHVEPAYLELWQDYHRAMRHRNSLIRAGIESDRELLSWELSMVKHGERITELRDGFLGRLQGRLDILDGRLLRSGLQVRYRRGWPEQGDYRESLHSARKADIRAGYTRLGPHRADLMISLGDRQVASTCSRGEIKQVILLLSTAQSRVFEEMTGEMPLFLVDDFAAELDEEARSRVVSLMREINAQVFLTSTEQELGSLPADSCTRFHVEHGKPLKMVE